MKVWTWAAAVAAVVFYFLALDDDVYTVTSPQSLSWHVPLRKAYSIVAFALVGYLTGRATLESRRTPSPAALALTVALYSAAIEVGQFIEGSKEGLGWNAVDVACGGLGGFLGGVALKLRKQPRVP